MPTLHRWRWRSPSEVLLMRPPLWVHTLKLILSPIHILTKLLLLVIIVSRIVITISVMVKLTTLVIMVLIVILVIIVLIIAVLFVVVVRIIVVASVIVIIPIPVLIISVRWRWSSTLLISIVPVILSPISSVIVILIVDVRFVAFFVGHCFFVHHNIHKVILRVLAQFINASNIVFHVWNFSAFVSDIMDEIALISASATDFSVVPEARYRFSFRIKFLVRFFDAFGVGTEIVSSMDVGYLTIGSLHEHLVDIGIVGFHMSNLLIESSHPTYGFPNLIFILALPDQIF